MFLEEVDIATNCIYITPHKDKRCISHIFINPQSISTTSLTRLYTHSSHSRSSFETCWILNMVLSHRMRCNTPSVEIANEAQKKRDCNFLCNSALTSHSSNTDGRIRCSLLSFRRTSSAIFSEGISLPFPSPYSLFPSSGVLECFSPPAIQEASPPGAGDTEPINKQTQRPGSFSS